MRPMALAALLLVLDTSQFELWMEHAFYPVLFLVLVIASFGVPIPEDLPLIAAGLILNAHPGVASWAGTLLVATVGIMIGDTILYALGRRWGREVFGHPSVSWLLTPARLDRISQRFARWGTWVCFFARFVMGIRAAMCLTAGVTRFPFWRFFLADLSGALLSVPLFVGLGYWFAGLVPTLRAYFAGVSALVIGGLLALAIGFVVYEVRRHRQAAGPDSAPARARAGGTEGGSASASQRRLRRRFRLVRAGS